MNEKLAIPESVLNEILATPPENILQLADDSKTYACPFCGNGTHGKHGHGVEPYEQNGVFTYKCQVCGEKFNNIHIFAKKYNLNSSRDFVEVCKRAADELGITLVFEHNKIKPPDKTSTIKADISTADGDNLENIPEDLRRMIKVETYRRYHCKYIVDWLPVANRLRGFSSTPTPRIIVPSGNHYLARLTVPLETYKNAKDAKYIKDKPHEGTKALFGEEFITTDTKVVLVFEGEFDAMSVAQALEFDRNITPVATSGAAEKKWIDIFISKCKALKICPFVIIIFDQDKAGRENAPKRVSDLIARYFPATFVFLDDSDEKLDANDILHQADGNFILDDLINELIKKNSEHLEEVKSNIENEKQLKLKEMFLSPEQYKYLFEILSDTSDLDNAERMAYLWHNDIRYIADSDNWANYDTDKGVWIINPNSKNTALNSIVKKTSEVLSINAKGGLDNKIADCFKNQRKYSPAITTMKGNELITITNDDFNRHKTIVKKFGGKLIAITNRDLITHKNLLNCLNCVVDLETGKTYEQAPAFNWTQYANAEFHAGFHNLTVDKFLVDIQPNEQTREALLRFFGYALTGFCNEEKFLFMDGTGGNGKGTFSGLIMNIANNYACSFPVAGILLSGKVDANAATPAYNMLENSRIAMAEEIPANMKMDSSKIKLLTGGDRVPVRKMFQEYSVIKDPTHTMIFSGNNLPEIGDIHDPGILRRLLRIIFKQNFNQKPDTHLKQKLLTNDARSAMLSILVEQAQKWFSEGLIISDEMQIARKQYINSQDFIGSFIAEYCERDRNSKIARKEFLKRLQEEYPKETRNLSDQTLTKMIEKVEGVSYRIGAHKYYYFYGVSWKNSSQQTDLGDDFATPPEI